MCVMVDIVFFWQVPNPHPVPQHWFICSFFKVEYSGKMEPFATKILLGRLHKQRMDIRVFTTDRSTQLKTLLKELNEIRVAKGLRPLKHSFDVWHLSKSVCKDLWAASKLKKCQTLGLWIKSVRNMMYFEFAN